MYYVFNYLAIPAARVSVNLITYLLTYLLTGELATISHLW